MTRQLGRPGRRGRPAARTLSARLLRAGVLLAGGLLTVFAAVLTVGGGVSTGARAAANGGAAAPTPPRAVIILVDIHPTNPGIEAAERAAVVRYARALPPDVRAGLILFSDRWRLVLRPTANRARLAAAVAAIQLTGGTANGLYPAIEAAEAVVSRLHATAGSRLVVFSDGEELSGAVPASSLPADVVTWRIDFDDHLGKLRAFARTDHGHAVSLARAASLAPAFPPLPAASPTVSPPGGGSTGQPAPATPPPPRPATSRSHHLSWTLAMPLAEVFAAVFLVTLLIIGSLRRHERGRELTEQIGQYGPQQAPAAPEGEGKVASAAIGWTARLLRSSNTERNLAERLELAGISRKPAEWVVLGVCLATVLAVALTVLARNLAVGILGGAVITWPVMRLVVSMRIGRRRAAFSEQLPDVLQLIAGSLQTGFSLPQALDAVVREDTQPTSAEFSRALAEARIGADLEDALDGVAARMASEDMRWTVMAIRIQRGVGGNLAEVLRNTVDTMRERAFLRRQVRALSAEGRLSAYILSVLPVAVGGWLLFMDPKYMRPLYTTTLGLLMLGVTAVLYTVGVLWMRKVIKVVV